MMDRNEDPGGFEGLMVGSRKPLVADEYRQEIERAVDNAKRSAWDKWFRRAWYRAGALRNRRHRAGLRRSRHLGSRFRGKRYSSTEHRGVLSSARKW